MNTNAAEFRNTDVFYVRTLVLPACAGTGDCGQGDRTCKTPDVCQKTFRLPAVFTARDLTRKRDDFGLIRAVGFAVVFDIALIAICGLVWLFNR